jgi:ABC-type phosphate transport system substrate-binding protein
MRPSFIVLLVLSLSLLVALVPVVVVSSVSIPTTVSISINNLYLPLLRRAHTAYTLDHPEFTSVTFTTSSGSAGSITHAASNAFDIIISTNSVPYAVQPTVPTIKSYPFLVNAFTPYYNLPVKTVGSAQLVLTMLAACQIWRKNITVW